MDAYVWPEVDSQNLEAGQIPMESSPGRAPEDAFSTLWLTQTDYANRGCLILEDGKAIPGENIALIN